MTEYAQQFTPGPWRYDSGMVYTADLSIPIARMDREPGNGTFGAERDANARLIAAAPDLLAACEAMIGQYVAFVTQGAAMIHNQADRAEYMAQHRGVETLVIDAIRKARGDIARAMRGES